MAIVLNQINSHILKTEILIVIKDKIKKLSIINKMHYVLTANLNAEIKPRS